MLDGYCLKKVIEAYKTVFYIRNKAEHIIIFCKKSTLDTASYIWISVACVVKSRNVISIFHYAARAVYAGI